jgi:hypothetical protein
VAVVLAVVYIVLLLWHKREEQRSTLVRLLRASVSSLPLLGLVLVAYHIMGAGSLLAVLAAILLLLGALLVTLILLPRLSYMTLVTVWVLLLANGLLVGRAVVGVVALGDYTWQTPAELGHPPGGGAVADLAPVDLTSLGLEWTESTDLTWVDNVWVGRQAKTTRAVYKGNDSRVFLTVAEFESPRDADQFFVAWKEAVSGRVRLVHFEINLPGLPDQGRIVRGYSAQAGQAYSAWQTEEWVTIIEVPGTFAQAMPLSQAVKKLVANGYRQSEIDR